MPYKDKNKKYALNKIWREKNKEALYEKQKEWRKKNGYEAYRRYYEKNKHKIIEYRIKNKDHASKRYSVYSKQRIESLTDGYVRKLLQQKGFKKEQITLELIETEKLIIKIKRKCKQKTSNN